MSRKLPKQTTDTQFKRKLQEYVRDRHEAIEIMRVVKEEYESYGHETDVAETNAEGVDEDEAS